MIIRRIEEKDNAAMAGIVRECLTEYGYAGRMDSAWGDESLNYLSKVYEDKKTGYWIAENDEGIVVAGVGIGNLFGETDICELQKMYCLKEYRGKEISQKLLDTALLFAEKFYKKCYLETFDNMYRAQNFYKRNGFVKTDLTLGKTGHSGCQFHMIKEL